MIGDASCVVAPFLSLLRLTSATVYLADAHHGIAVRSPARQGIPHQSPSVMSLSLLPSDVILIHHQSPVHARFHSGALQYNISNTSLHRTHSASGRASRSTRPFIQRAMAIPYCNLRVRRHWDIAWRTHPSGCWHGYTRSSSNGQTLTLGQTKKVRPQF